MIAPHNKKLNEKCPQNLNENLKTAVNRAVNWKSAFRVRVLEYKSRDVILKVETMEVGIMTHLFFGQDNCRIPNKPIIVVS